MANTTRIGNPQVLFESQVSTMVARRSLPEVVGFLVSKRGPEQAERDLRDISRIITERMLLVWTPKKHKPFEIVKEMMKLFFGNNKVKGKVIEKIKGRPKKIAVRDHDCPICPEKKGEELEVTEIHYCVPVAGFIESIIQYLMDKDLVPYTKVSCKTVKSVGSVSPLCILRFQADYVLWHPKSQQRPAVRTRTGTRAYSVRW